LDMHTIIGGAVAHMSRHRGTHSNAGIRRCERSSWMRERFAEESPIPLEVRSRLVPSTSPGSCVPETSERFATIATQQVKVLHEERIVSSKAKAKKAWEPYISLMMRGVRSCPPTLDLSSGMICLHCRAIDTYHARQS